MSKKNKYCCFYFVFASSAVLAACISLLVVNPKIDTVEDVPIDYLRQIKQDWTREPFTDIVVTEEWQCPAGYSEVFTRPWYGIKQACDCLGVSLCDNCEGSRRFNMLACSELKKASECRDVPAFPPVW